MTTWIVKIDPWKKKLWVRSIHVEHYLNWKRDGWSVYLEDETEEFQPVLPMPIKH